MLLLTPCSGGFRTLLPLLLLVVVAGLAAATTPYEEVQPLRGCRSNISSLSDVIARLESSSHLRYYNWMSSTGQHLALLDAMHGDSELRQLVAEEARLLGFNTSSSTFRLRHGKGTPLKQFPCLPFGRGPQPPSTVHALSPADIDVVAAIGDSLSAGTGVDARSIFTMRTQYRGRVFHTGGDGDANTSPSIGNILRKYNPNLVGISTGKGDFNSKGAGFNVANPGDTSLNLLPQAQLLVSRMQDKLKENFNSTWKLVTVFMGHNDICYYCKKGNEGKFSAQHYRQRLQDSLDYLHVNSPRTLVNLVTMLDTFLAKQLNVGLVCSAIHHFGCPCAAFPKDFNAVVKMNNEFQITAYDLIQTGRYDKDPQFTVVAQPFFEQTTLPVTPSGKIDLSFFSPDCFHFSGKGHAAAALGLWNSMFEPVGMKKKFWHLDEPYECPSKEKPYIRTSKN